MLLADEMIMLAEEERGDNWEEPKPSLEVTEIDIHKIEDNYYFVSSENDIFILNQPNEYSRKLTNDEINNLPVKVVWVRNVPGKIFVSDDEKAVDACLRIIENFNKMVPDPRFHGFVVASLVTHLRAFLYEQIIDEQRFFYTILTLSGDQHGTGNFCQIAISIIFALGFALHIWVVFIYSP